MSGLNNLKVTNVSTGGTRTPVVDDVSPQVAPQAVPQVAPQVQEVQTSIEKLQHDLSQLAKVGKIEEEHIIFGFKFRMSTLTALQNTEVLEAVANIEDNDTKFSMMRYHLLSRGIQSINGVPLEALYKGTEEKSNLEKRIEIIGSWQQIFVNNIFDKYDDMVARSNNANKEEIALKN